MLFCVVCSGALVFKHVYTMAWWQIFNKYIASRRRQDDDDDEDDDDDGDDDGDDDDDDDLQLGNQNAKKYRTFWFTNITSITICNRKSSDRKRRELCKLMARKVPEWRKIDLN